MRFKGGEGGGGVGGEGGAWRRMPRCVLVPGVLLDPAAGAERVDANACAGSGVGGKVVPGDHPPNPDGLVLRTEGLRGQQETAGAARSCRPGCA